MLFNKIYLFTTPVILGFAYFASSGFTIKDESDTQYLTPVVFQEKSDLQKSISRGKDIYTDFCVQCHLANGKGDNVNFPPVDASDWLSKKRTQSIYAVKYGQTGIITVNGKKFNNNMPDLGLENQEVADVMNYIMNSWTNKQKKMVTLEEVKAVSKK